MKTGSGFVYQGIRPEFIVQQPAALMACCSVAPLCRCWPSFTARCSGARLAM